MLVEPRGLPDRDGQPRARLDRDRARRDERQLVRPPRLAAHRPASIGQVLVLQDVGRVEVGLGIVGVGPTKVTSRGPAEGQLGAGIGRLRDGLGPDRLAFLIEHGDADAGEPRLQAVVGPVPEDDRGRSAART